MLDLVLPCFNPAHGWAQTVMQKVQELQAQLPQVCVHVILVNDGSQGIQPEDVQLLKRGLPHFTYVAYPENKGKGYALRMGVTHSTAPLCLYTDIDFPYTIPSMVQLFQALSSPETNIAVGVRDAAYYTHVPFVRARISDLLKALTRYLLRLTVNDTQCGLKGFDRKGKKLFLATTINRYLFDLEFIYLACNAPEPVSMQPVTVQLKPGVVFSKMGFKILFSESLSFLKIFLLSASGRVRRIQNHA